MIEGFYSVAFRGQADWGMGVLVLYNGTVAGADVGGVSYDGFYTIETSIISIALTLTVPAGIALVQGKQKQPKPYSIKIDMNIHPDQILTAVQLLVQIVYGPVNVIFKKLRNVPDVEIGKNECLRKFLFDVAVN